jgi:glycosyltransferase involved in cell wall biosynthesis
MWTRSLSLLRDVDDVMRTSDLVHINGAYDRLNHRVSSACELAGVPYIVSPRSLLDPAALDVLPGGVRADLAADERRYLESAFAVHFTTAFEADRACLDGARLRRTVTIPNAVDLGQLDRLPLRQQARAVVGIPAQQCALLYLGRLIAQKQPEFAVRVLAETDPALDAHLYMVGWSDATARAQLQAVAAALHVADRVHFTGHAAAERDYWLAAADMLLLPSSAENFSLVLVETVAAGLPAIVSPRIGVLELLRPEDARVVPLRPRAWAAAIEETAAAPPVRDGTAFYRMGKQFSSVNLVPR